MKYPANIPTKDLAKWKKNVEKLEFVWPHVTKWGCAIDCGAQLGLYSKRLLEHFGEVFAYEPVAENYECILENTESPRLHLKLAAVGDRNGDRAFGLNKVKMAKPKGSDITAKLVTLDADMFPRDDVGLIKIDVEGMEVEVLSGAKSIIERCSPVLFIEVKFFKPSIQSWMKSNSYECVWNDHVDAIYKR